MKTLIAYFSWSGNTVQIAEKLAKTRKHRDGAKRAVSIYGWASLRSTFCRLAIERGVDEKMIMKAVGHSNFKTTMTYYDNPTRAHQREVMKAKMAPTAIGHTTTPSPAAAAILNLVERLPADQQLLLAEGLKSRFGNTNGEPMRLITSA